MEPETKTCQNCKSDFVIEPEDFDFYRKIDVPAPTFCPTCRMQRRFAWRNERNLFRNTCAATGKSIITGFHRDSGIPVYERDYWWSDAWDAQSFGLDYDFNQPFFFQFRELLEKVPMPSVFNSRTTNVVYSNYGGEYKDAYMISASWGGENVAYASRANSTRDSVDVLIVVNCNLCYEAVTSDKIYNTHFCQDCESCTDSWFLYGCKGCANCFGCTNLRGKSYYIWNQPYSKEEYSAKLKELNPSSYTALEQARKRFEELKRSTIRKYAQNINCHDVTGDYVSNAANCRDCFSAFGGIKDCKYLLNALDLNDCYDGYGVGAKMELSYEAFDSGVQGMKQCFVGTIYGGADIFYSLNCHGCNNLFGCIGLRNKEYCIFNKQYTKEEFEDIRTRIVKQMADVPYVDRKGREYRFGEYFPIELSPFAYNESVAQEYFPLTAESAASEKFVWREPEYGTYEITKSAHDLPENIKDVTDEIMKEVVACAGCGRAYRFIPQELQFLRRVGIPLPRYCFECRHRRRFLQVNAPRLYNRKCMKPGCPNEFETSYAPDRPETIYCETCYNSEVA